MMKFVYTALLLTTALWAQPNEALLDLSNRFWAWRYVAQPAGPDDIPRVERPDGWAPDFSAAALSKYRDAYDRFRKELSAIPRKGWGRADSVDYLLLHSAIERVNWELNVLRAPHRNPDFYVHQTIGSLYELLLIHTPFTEQRAENLFARLQAIPGVLRAARGNLTEPVAAFARIARENLAEVDEKMIHMAKALEPQVSKRMAAQLGNSARQAADALTAYDRWLVEQLPQMSSVFNIGRENYEYFLENIALIPYSPEELLAQGRLEWHRSVSFETYSLLRNRKVPDPPIFESAADQIRQERIDEQAIRDFLEAHDIMSVPDWLQHYLNKKTPDHVVPFAHMGVVDDLTWETRLDEDAVSYIPEPHPGLSFFRLATAKDPRPIIVHEGVPGHYYQMAISWKHPNPIRRRYFDSGANEGIGFYVEELMLQFGLFDDRPRTRDIIYNFMRLRALRVEVDIQLALGTFSIEEAGEFLAKSVPMDRPTAVEEAGFFAYNPGQAITYQIGKLQILKFLSDAKIQMGDEFKLRDFHDYLMLNGNVPIALLRWEYLGLHDEMDRLLSGNDLF